MKYNIKVTETITANIKVSAIDKEDALTYALQKYENYNAKQLDDCLASLHFEITEETSDDN